MTKSSDQDTSKTTSGLGIGFLALVLGMMPWWQVWLWSNESFTMYFRGIVWSVAGIVFIAILALRTDEWLVSLAALVGMLLCVSCMVYLFVRVFC